MGITRSRLRFPMPALILSCLALFATLGGSTYAATPSANRAAHSAGNVSGAGAAARTVKVGQLFTPTFTSCHPGYTILQTGVASGRSYTIPKAGVITSWSFHDGVNPVPGLELKIGRSAGGKKYTIVGQAKAGSQTANAVNTYKTHIAVKAGDLIGVYQHGGTCDSFPTSSTMDTDVEKHRDVAPGTTASFPVAGTNVKWPVSVRVRLRH